MDGLGTCYPDAKRKRPYFKSQKGDDDGAQGL